MLEKKFSRKGTVMVGFTMGLMKSQTFNMLGPKSVSFRSCYYSSKLFRYLRISNEVTHALEKNYPVVTLESTIITHGMPYPQNIETALEVESIIREQACIPATVAVIDGLVRVGLDKALFWHLGESKNVAKLGKRDIPYAVFKKLTGGTTVSGTSFISSLCKIPVFVTGGIGGVHYGWSSTMDVSADLYQLKESPVALVCAGAKSILDIPKTLECLETLGVPVVTLGGNCQFPAFYLTDSGFCSPYHLNSPIQCAEFMDTHFKFDCDSGILIGVPIPEDSQLDATEINRAIQEALDTAGKLGYSGKKITPFLLSKVNELTKGKALLSNIALVKNNALMGSKIALEYSKLKSRHLFTIRSTSDASLSPPTNRTEVIVVGASNIDLSCHIEEESVQEDGRTHNSSISLTCGGVARNIADCLTRLDVKTKLVTAVGNDPLGEFFRNLNSHIDLDLLTFSGPSTAVYSVTTNKNGDNVLSSGDMKIHSKLSVKMLEQCIDKLKTCRLIVMDGNLPEESIDYLSEFGCQHGIPVWFEPSEMRKSCKPFRSGAWKKLSVISPNLNELQEVSLIATGKGPRDSIDVQNLKLSKVLELTLKFSKPLIQHIPLIIVTLGRNGVVLIQRGSSLDPLPPERLKAIKTATSISATHCHKDFQGDVRNVTGAGDCLAAGIIAGMLDKHCMIHNCAIGIECAQRSIQNPEAVPNTIDRDVTKRRQVSYQFLKL